MPRSTPQDPSTDTFYLTTAIDYPNGLPHVGHAYEKSVADFYVRWYRLRGRRTRFLTGLDEHGQKIQEAADKAGVSPREFVDGKAGAFRDLCERLSISNDDFIRTSEARHHRFATSLYERVDQAGDIYLGHYEGEYCVSCENYYTESQLVDGKCPIHERPTERLKEESYFFRLGKYREWIRDHIRANPEFVYPPSRRNEILSRLDEDVRDLSISRCSFDWGIPVPGNPKHVMYVWFDALSNYISALKEPDDVYDIFWPADVHVVGKDIIWFHTVIWPCMLHAAGLPVPKQVYVHGFVLDHEGRKMAKHLGNVVDPLQMIERYGAEVVRYYFLRALPSGQDGKFSESDLVDRYNSELGNDLGNLVMRLAKLATQRCGGRVAAGAERAPELDSSSVVAEFSRLVDGREHQKAMETLWSLVRGTNAYLNEKAPWKQSDEAAVRTVLYNALESLRVICNLLAPAMPETAANIAGQIGVALDEGEIDAFGSVSFTLTRGEPLFPRIEPKDKAAKGDAPASGGSSGKPSKKRGEPAIDPFAKLDIRVGRIAEVSPHPDADALWVFRVSLGPDPESGEDRTRTICAGLRAQLSADELRGRSVAVLANLKPAKLRGVESRGMVLATDRRDGVVVPVDPGEARPGSPVGVEGVEPAPKAKLSTRDFGKVALVMRGGDVSYEGRPLRTPVGTLRADAEDGAPVR